MNRYMMEETQANAASALLPEVVVRMTRGQAVEVVWIEGIAAKSVRPRRPAAHQGTDLRFLPVRLPSSRAATGFRASVVYELQIDPES
jgi:hypothetical protein